VVEWDVTRYVEKLPKKFPKPGTDASNDREESLRRQYRPLAESTASTPCIIVDMQGIILAWYLPGVLSDYRQVSLVSLSDHGSKPDTSQNAMLTARDKLRLLLEKSLSGRTWRENVENYRKGDGPQGSVNLSPAWFQQAHDVSTLTDRIYFSAAYSK
jgi:hypothetical protein